MQFVRKIEAALLRAEAAAISVLVLLMLALAAYNVAYRNILVPVQRHYATSGPAVLVAPLEQARPNHTEHGEPAGAEGFGGGFSAGERAEGGEDFGGGFSAGESAEGGEGFGGGFSAGEGAEGFGGDMADQGAQVVSALDGAEETEDRHLGTAQGGPPAPGSFAARIVSLIDALKIDWIDVFLRQLVIFVSFLGAMLATQRHKHINIDALGKVLPAKTRAVVGIAVHLLAMVVCVILARAGWNLVMIGREFPKDLLPWADEWQLQSVFPLGFGLLAFHFAVRVMESAVAGVQRHAGQSGGGAR